MKLEPSLTANECGFINRHSLSPLYDIRPVSAPQCGEYIFLFMEALCPGFVLHMSLHLS